MKIETVQQYVQVLADMRNVMGESRPLPEGWHFPSPEHVLLAYGRVWPDDGPLLPKGVRWGPPKSCFYNAYRLALRRPDLTYVEGYAGRIIPCEHAWCVDAHGNVVDNTWRPLPGCPDGTEYFGIPVRTDYLKRVLGKRPTIFGLLQNHVLRWPLMSADPAEWLDPRWCGTCGQHEGATFPHKEITR